MREYLLGDLDPLRGAEKRPDAKKDSRLEPVEGVTAQQGDDVGPISECPGGALRHKQIPIPNRSAQELVVNPSSTRGICACGVSAFGKNFDERRANGWPAIDRKVQYGSGGNGKEDS